VCLVCSDRSCRACTRATSPSPQQACGSRCGAHAARERGGHPPAAPQLRGVAPALDVPGGALRMFCPHPGPPETQSGGEGLGAALGRWAWPPGEDSGGW